MGSLNLLKYGNSLSELQQNNIEIHSKETFKNNLDLELNSKKNFNISHHVKKRKKKRISSTKKKPTQIIANNDIQNLEKVNNDNQKNILENNSNNFDINNFIKSDDIPIGNNTVKKFENEPINIKTDIIKISQCCLCCVNKKKNMTTTPGSLLRKTGVKTPVFPFPPAWEKKKKKIK